MSTLKLGRVYWYMGQTLLPEHMVALEESLLAATVLRGRTQGLPGYGVMSLGLNEALLRDGVFALTNLTALFPDGSVVDVPATCSVAPLSLSATGATNLSVYLHVLTEHYESEGNRVYESDPNVVQRVLYHAQLSSMDALEGSQRLIKVAEVQKAADGVWSLSGSFLPPLLAVGQSPYLRPALAELEQLMTTLEPQLSGQLLDTFLRPERLVVLRSALVAISRMQSLLKDMAHKLAPHPYQLFEKLRELYFGLCILHEVLPDDQVLTYRHDDLGRSFTRLFAVLQTHLRPVFARSTHLKFIKANGLFTLSHLPEEAKLAQEVYLLIQRDNVHQQVPINEVKLSCTSRLALVHRLILRGVAYKHIERPPFQHPFGAEVDFYQLMFGEEWNHALAEGSISMYIHPVLEKANAYLFWR
jgi:type VI secretion system protein ImpJ